MNATAAHSNPPSPPSRCSTPGWKELAAVALAGIVFGACWSIWTGQDINWDLRNYYYYSAYAWLDHRVAYHIAPGQMQSWINPLAFLPKYFLINHASPIVAGALFGAFEGLAFVLVYFLARLVIVVEDTALAIALSLLAAVAGIAGPEFLEGLGRTSSDNPSGMVVIAGLCAICAGIRPNLSAGQQSRYFALSGSLLGVAAGLKLTCEVYAIGLTLTLLWLWPRLRFRLRSFGLYAVGGVLGFLATAGYWSWFLWRNYDNPIFPYYNAALHSPYAIRSNFRDTHAIPGNITTAISYPFQWFVGQNWPDDWFRDARFALLSVLLPMTLLALAAEFISRRRKASAPREDDSSLVAPQHFWLLVTFFLISYIYWLQMFSIQRYLVPLGLTSGLTMLLLLDRILAVRSAKVAVFAALVIFSAAWTRPDNRERVPYSKDWFGIELTPTVSQPNTLFIVMGDSTAAGYVVPFLPQSSRVVRISGNFPLNPDEGLGLQSVEIINRHDGPIRSLALDPLGARDRFRLSQFGLNIDESNCAALRTRMDLFTSCTLTRGSARALLTIEPRTRVVAWNAPGIAGARVYIHDANGGRRLFAEGTQGELEAVWLQPGTRFVFELFEWQGTHDGPMLARVTADEQGKVSREIFLSGKAAGVQ